MRSDRMREYHLDDLRLQVRLAYDEASGRYLEQIPDFEEEPLYTARGKPVVCAAQDACAHSRSDGNESCVDCGDCRCFEPPHPNSLIGICGHPARCRQAHSEEERYAT